MKLALRFLALLIGLSSAFASAKVVTFPADNFSLDVPEDWKSFATPPMPERTRLATAARSPTNGHVYCVMITETPVHIAPEAFLAGMKEPMEKMGWTASETRDRTINGNPFAVFTMSRSAGQPPFAQIASIFTENSVYAIQIATPSSNVENAPDLDAILHSFQFLTPVETFSRHDAVIGTKAYRLGYSIGNSLRRNFGTVIIGMAVGVVLAAALAFMLIRRGR